MPPFPGRYIEPFLGSGAMFFALGPRVSVLGDRNAALINAFTHVRDNVEGVLDGLDRLTASRDGYQEERGKELSEGLAAAVRFLYLNRLGWNGVYRVNRNGQFNVPYGDGTRDLEYFRRNDRLRLASAALRDVELEVADFETSIDRARDGDLVYCDPEYLPPGGAVSRLYTPSSFSSGDLNRLMNAISNAVARGAIVLLSWENEPPTANSLVPTCQMISRQSTIAARARTGMARRELLLTYRPEPAPYAGS